MCALAKKCAGKPMVSCLMGDSTALASAIVRCCLRFCCIWGFSPGSLPAFPPAAGTKKGPRRKPVQADGAGFFSSVFRSCGQGANRLPAGRRRFSYRRFRRTRAPSMRHALPFSRLGQRSRNTGSPWHRGWTRAVRTEGNPKYPRLSRAGWPV